MCAHSMCGRTVAKVDMSCVNQVVITFTDGATYSFEAINVGPNGLIGVDVSFIDREGKHAHR